MHLRLRRQVSNAQTVHNPLPSNTDRRVDPVSDVISIDVFADSIATFSGIREVYLAFDCGVSCTDDTHVVLLNQPKNVNQTVRRS